MKDRPLLTALILLLASTPVAAQKCPSLDITMLNKGFHEVAPWRTVSGGPAECSFMGKTSSINLGFSHMVARSDEAATAAASEMRQAVAPTSVIEPILALGQHGFAYQQKTPSGQVDPPRCSSTGIAGRSAYRDISTSRIPSRVSNASSPPA